MKKNISRKYLATGAGLALAATGLVALPASAAPAITIAPNVGTGWSVLASDNFSVKVYGNTDFTFTASTDLQWEITQTSGQTVNVDDAASYTTALTAGAGSTATVKWYDHAETISAVAGANKLTINPTGSSTFKTSEVKVRAYIELDGTPGFTSGDLGSNQETIKFLGSADLAGAALDWTVPVAANDVVASFTATGLNYAQITNGSAVVSWSDNATVTTADINRNDGDTSDALEATYAGTSVATGDIIGVKVQVAEYEGGSLKDVVAYTYKTADGSTADEIALLDIANSASVRNDDTLDKVLKKGTLSATVTATVKKSSAAVAAGIPVSVTVSEIDDSNDLDEGTVVAAGGKKITGDDSTADDQSISFVVYTDASGAVSIPFTTTVGAADEAIQFTLATGTATQTLSVRWLANDVNAAVELSAADGVRSAVKGSSLSLSVAVVDDFGQNFVDATKTYQIAVTTSGTSGSTATSAVPYTGTPVSIAWADNSTAAGALTATIKLQVLNTATPPAYEDVAGISTTAVFEIVAAAPVAAAVTASTYDGDGATAYDITDAAETDHALTLKDYANVDLRADSNTNEAPVSAFTSVIKGAVSTASGAAVPGAVVTVSAPGVLFANDDANVFSADSITVNADATGNYIVNAASHTAGTITFTVTSGAASKTAKIAFAAAAPNTGKTLTLSAPAAVTPGSTLKVTGLLVDKYGNPVDTDQSVATDTEFSVTFKGPGLVVGSLPAETGADGTFELGILLGSNDTGSIVVTANYGGADKVLSAATDNVTTQATVVVGTVGNTGDLAAWTKNLNDGTVKMYAKNIVGAGKVQFMLNGEEIAWVRAIDATDPKLRMSDAGAYYLVRTVELVEGQKNALEIYLDGVRIERNAYSY